MLSIPKQYVIQFNIVRIKSTNIACLKKGCLRIRSYNNLDFIRHFLNYFVCVGVMYSGEYDVCDVTLSVHPHRASRKVNLATVEIEPAPFGIL